MGQVGVQVQRLVLEVESVDGARHSEALGGQVVRHVVYLGQGAPMGWWTRQWEQRLEVVAVVEQ